MLASSVESVSESASLSLQEHKRFFTTSLNRRVSTQASDYKVQNKNLQALAIFYMRHRRGKINLTNQADIDNSLTLFLGAVCGCLASFPH